MLLNYKVIVKLFGAISVLISLTMLPALFVSYLYDEPDVAAAFIQTIVPAFLIGILVHFRVKPSSSDIRIRDGYFIAAVSWFLVSAIGAFPYVFSGVMPSFIDAFFESVAGFTTTGATIIDDLSQIPKGILFWRSFCNWLGGMGILILTISMLPALGIGGMKIASVEAPGPVIEKMSTRISDSARILYTIYISFTIVEFILLHLGGMNAYDALVHTFGCIGTGGLSNYSSGIAHFNSPYIETIITTFSILAAFNFALYHHAAVGKWKSLLKNRELRTFVILLFCFSVIVTLNLWATNTYDSFSTSLRYAIFHVVSFMSTSGYTTTDYTFWPSASQLIIFLAMIIGGCSSSTCGGIKVIRLVILVKLIIRGIYKRLHPNSVVPVKVGGNIVSAEIVTRVSSYMLLYLTIFIFSSLLLSLENLDLLTTISAAAGALSNTAMGFGLLGPNGSYSIFSGASRLYLSVLMIAGRLELFAIIMLLSPSFWRAR